MLENVVGPPLAGVTEQTVDGQSWLYAPSTEQAVILNDSATAVWRLADGRHGIATVCTLVATAYCVPELAVGADVRSAIAAFVAAGLIPPVHE